MRRGDIPDRSYTRKEDGASWHYDELVRMCLGLDESLRDGYECLQDLYRCTKVRGTYTEALSEIRFVARKLKNCKNEILTKVADTYKKWENEIARGLAKNDLGGLLTNAKMEAGNDVAQTMIDAAYGYKNFDRFRKRFLLMRRVKAAKRAKEGKLK